MLQLESFGETQRYRHHDLLSFFAKLATHTSVDGLQLPIGVERGLGSHDMPPAGETPSIIPVSSSPGQVSRFDKSPTVHDHLSTEPQLSDNTSPGKTGSTQDSRVRRRSSDGKPSKFEEELEKTREIMQERYTERCRQNDAHRTMRLNAIQSLVDVVAGRARANVDGPCPDTEPINQSRSTGIVLDDDQKASLRKEIRSIVEEINQSAELGYSESYVKLLRRDLNCAQTRYSALVDEQVRTIGDGANADKP